VRTGAGAAAGLLMTLALAACGIGGTRASSSATTTSVPAATGTRVSGTGTPADGAGSDTGTRTTSTTQTAATTTGRSSSQGRGRNGHKGDDVPAAPGGLAQTAGYGTYERCQGTCTGAVPATLRRPLKLPSDDGGPCPITLNAEPVSPREIPAGVGFRSVSGSGWRIAEVTWTVPGSYTGPLLIRGEMLGGGVLGFGTSAVPYDELQLLDAGRGAPRVAGGGRAWITYSRIRSEGCYAYQVDGTGFSEVVVFRAIA
jgi:hypothetical protein